MTAARRCGVRDRLWRKRWIPAPIFFLAICVLATCAVAQAPVDPNAGKQLLRQFAGSDDNFGFLQQPKIHAQLQELLDKELPHLMDNLNVSGSVDVVGGDLTVNGNAPHQGTEEEAVVCVSTYNLDVSAAIFSKGMVTAYSHKKTYDDLSRCIKDWITLVNSEHRDRAYQPKNVRIAGKLSAP